MADGTSYGSKGRSFCAASASVPLGTKYKVTSMRTGITMVISVRDHGPLSSRHLDLSRSAFRRLSRNNFKIGIEHIRFIMIEKDRRNKHAKH